MDPHAPKLDEQALKAHKDKHERAIRAMEKRVKKNQDGTLVIDAKDASELGVDPDVFKNLQQSLEETNRKSNLARYGRTRSARHMTSCHDKVSTPTGGTCNDA